MATPLADLVYQLCKRNQYCSSKFQDLQQKEEWTLTDKKKVLALLTELFVQPTCTEDVTHCSSTILLDLVERVKNVVHETTAEQRITMHQMFCIALSKAVTVCPSLKRFFLCYLKSSPPFLHTDHDVEEPKSKKLRLDDSRQPLSETHHLELVQTAYRCVVILGRESELVVSLEHLLPFLTFSNKDVQWFAVQTLATLLQMSARQKDIFTKRYFQKEEIVQLSLRYRKLLLWPELPGNGFAANEQQLQVPTYIADNGLLSSKVVSVSGVLLPKLASSHQTEQKTELIPVASTMNNLQSLAEAVVLGKPVLLQGPVGSGKTCLVESLAQMTGRHKSPQLLKLQLGDQTDSRALVGIYQCTDIPGEFVWQPGVLTRAVSEGYWVLLEDIDRAPMDVISLLLPLLETNTLMIPNRGQRISASPGFQLFATLRVFPGTGPLSNILNSGMSVLLDKSWTKVNVEPLSKDELYEVISQKYPSLQSIIDRLLEIYFLLSRGEHSGTVAVDESKLVGFKVLSSDKRLISTRDLLNWCKRILSHNLTSSDISDLVFQETLDCFCFSISCPSRRLQMAEAMGVKLNINKTKAEYYCMKYKPALQITESEFVVGRVAIPRKKHKFHMPKSLTATSIPFSFTRQSTALLEKVAACVLYNEPVLLVGETGTGKTSTIQYLAHQLKHTLHIINMNQQSDGTDLLGGFKPVDLKLVIKPFKESFEELFCRTFSRKQNIVFLTHIENCFSKKAWKDLLTLFEHTIKSAIKKQTEHTEIWKLWKKQEKKLKQMHVQIQKTENTMAFAFIEGTLVKALKNGDWVLLDEINLATAETLECLTGLLESQSGSVVLSERGDVEAIRRHPNFRLFACMNPATDVGKKSLTPSLRNRFMEFFVDELNEAQDLKILVNDYLSGLSLSVSHVDGLVNFYLQVQRIAAKQLTDGTGHKPHYSLRTFCRALMCSALNPAGNVTRSLYESICMSFLTQLDRTSYPVVEQLACRYLFEKNDPKTVLSRPMPEPRGKHVQIEGYWIPLGLSEPNVSDKYILTPSVCANLKDLARIVAIGHHPVLLQGETSVGKTSLVQWLASSTGNKCVRINNHEHTDLQEYLGTYSADSMGKLVFREGILVQAMRQGFWIILDELNLAPTDVLEALNRLLDDNRELFIPETQEMVKAHPKFMLFATQNPPGLYGGRKTLSRAFRNRFVELHFDEIPSTELETILSQRSEIPSSYAKKLVMVMLELQTRRSSSGVFAGKQGFMTLRDLFRWADRYHCPNVDTNNYDWNQHMADHGYMLLAGKMRKPEEEDIVQDALQKYFRRKVSPDCLFNVSPETSPTTAEMLRKLTGETIDNFEHIFWTPNMQRLAVLVGQAMKYKEPVLLVGETGCGKTTICQLYAAMNETELFTVNCHTNTESADFLGGLRPVRSHEEMTNGDQSQQKLFEWVDGPLVKAMENGCPFLIDEISLAEDSVLERLNSVLEPERTLLLAEKGSDHGSTENVPQIVADPKFCIFATMNPGGDFGKKELSPALRNRFTEIWCPQIASPGDMVSIIQHNLQPSIRFSDRTSNGDDEDDMDIVNAMMIFTEWFICTDLGKKCVVSIRDLLCWVHFMNTCSLSYEDVDEYMDVSKVDPCIAYVHGACLVFLDCIGTGATAQVGRNAEVHNFRDECLQFLLWQVNNSSTQKFTLESLELMDKKQTVYPNQIARRDMYFIVPPFSIPVVESQIYRNEKYAFHAPTTCMNAQRVLRGLQLSRPILLEGSPGVGKTSLVAAIAAAAGRELVRINLSEQTDIADLFGSDLPVEGGEGGMFCWRDGPFLQALKAGHWIILDELNLASQSVLEGLNACLDHRGEVFIPELGKTFYIQHANTRIFGCQNPYHQGSGRKGLPKSFLNRFTKVYIEALSRGDLQLIANTMFPSIPEKLLSNMVHFNMKIYNEVVVSHSWGHKGGPWEFNLRDLFRWCELLIENQPPDSFDPGEYLSLIYIDRMQNQADRDKVVELYQRTFSCIAPIYRPSGLFSLSLDWVQCGHSFLQRHSEHSMHVDGNKDLKMLPSMLPILESVMKCVQMNWLTILIGEQGSGKTSTVQMLADLTGNNLQILPMNSSMDTTELLGGFEQIDISCHIEEVATSLKLSIDSFSRKLLPLHHFTDVENNIACIHHLWHKYCRDVQKHHSANLTNTEELNYMKKQLKDLKVILVQLLDLNDEESDELLELDGQLSSLEQSLEQLENTTNGNVFEWINSVLVKALLSGDWLLIDNVNFCSSSVLDRLNALLEPSGVLTVSERGVIDGEIPEIVPHPNFRLFFTMDPKYGNISRAMRNRGVEIFILNKSDDKKMETVSMDVSNCGSAKTVAQLPLSSLPLAHQYCSHPLLTQAQHLVSVYIQVLRQLLSSQYSCPNVSASRWPLINFIQLVSNHVHSQNWKFCSELISPLLTEVQLEVNCSEMSTFGGWKSVCGQHDLPELTQVTLVALFDHPLKEILQNYLNSMKTSNNGAEILMRGPYDFRWNRQALHKMVSSSKSESSTTMSLFDRLTGIINRIRLSQVLTVEWQLSQEKFKKWEVLCEGTQHLGSEKSAHLEVFVYIDNVLVLLRQELRAAFTEQGDCSDKQFYQIYCGLAWLNRLLEVALQHWEKDLSPPTEAKLSLIWNWTFYKLLMPLLGHNSPVKLSEKIEKVINHIHKLLSDQNSASKLFKKMLAGWGNPQPCFSEHEYKQWKKVQDLAQCIELFGRGKYQQIVLTPQDILKLDRASITDQFLQLISQISSNANLKSTESNNLFESLFKDLENKISSVSSSSSVAEEDNEETSETSPNTSVTKSLTIKQQLWPLYEHTVLAVERSVLNLLLEQQEPQLATWLPPLVEFMKQHLPVSALNIAEYQKLFACLGQGTSKNFYSSIFSCYYLHWWQNSINNMNTELKSNQLTLFSPEVRGPGIAISGCLSEILNQLMSDHIGIESVNMGSVHFLSDSSILLPQVGIGHHKDTVQLFSQIRNHLWVHTASLSGPQFNGRNIERKNILETLQHTLTAIGLSLPQFCDSDIPDLHVLTNQSTMMNPYHFTEKLETFISQIKDCSYFDDVVISLTKKAITSVQEMLMYDDQSSVMATGSSLVLIGLLQSYLLVPRGHLDPVERDKLKLSHIQEDLEMISLELDMENVFAELMTGRSFSETCHNQLHPHIIWLMEHREKLTNKVHCVLGRTAYRPDVSLFPMLKKDYKNFLQTGGSWEFILNLLHKAKTLESSNTAANNDLSQFLQEINTWQRTIHNFLQKMQDNYSIYKDILMPFYSALHQMSHGFGLITQTLKISNNRSQLAKLGNLPKELEFSWLEDLYVGMSKFPSCSHSFPHFLKLSINLTSDLSLHLSQALMTKKMEKSKSGQEIVSQLLLSGLLHLKNHVLSSQQLSFEVLEHLSTVLDLFVSAWHKREEERKKLEQEKESLYRFKTVYHDSGPDDEKVIENDFRQRFPNYQKDFVDLMPSDLLESVVEPEESKQVDESASNDEISLILSKEEMKEIHGIHYQLFTSFTRPVHWIVLEQEPKEPGTGADLLKPFLLTYKTITSLASELSDCWHEAYDPQVVGGHLLVSAALEEVINQHSFAQLGVVQNPVVDHCYDVYRDANITEIIQCEPVIRRLLQRLQQLQEEWPDHPTLKQLETIANRILSFPLTSPIMKVLSGLELLLHKAQDWEGVAAKHVSLEAELHDISNLIVDWRKFELGYWKNSLDITSHEVEVEASRWWFHLYQLVFAFIQPAQETDHSKPDSDIEKEVIASLKQFLENSSLGEFKVRLRIVYAFHCQLANMDSSPKQKLLMKLLWNIHEFYKQFLPAVESEIDKRRIPIEKELKGFVKIARWTDINYWALRQATEKTHRTVHKHIQTFRKVLLESVKSVLVSNSASTEPHLEAKELTPDIWLQPITWVGDCNVSADSDVCLPEVPEGSLLCRLPTLLPRLSKHYTNLQKRIPYPKMLLAFDEFTCEVIEGIEERRNMTVKPSADMDKKKKEAKHINLKQRQGLASLYKYLAKIGLSYKKGLIRSEEDHGDAFLYINPVDIQATVETVGTTSARHAPVFKSMWKSSQKFYLNCLARHNQLKSILQNPEAKDFGLSNIDRCRGFSEHMKQVLLDQQCMLAKLSDNYFELRKILTSLKCPGLQKSISLPPQNEFSDWLTSLEKVTVKCFQGLSQFQILLKCCPISNSSNPNSCSTPLPVHTLPQTSFMTINDPTWNLCMEKIDEALSKVKTIFKRPLTKLRNKTIYSWNDLYILESGYVHLRESLVPLQQIELMFLEPEYGSDSCFSEPLTFLQSEIQAGTDAFFFWHKKQKPDEISAVIKQFEGQAKQLEQHSQKSTNPLPDENLLKDYFDSLIAKVLFPVQKLLENHKETEEKTKNVKSEKSTEKTAASSESDTEILTGHLTQHLHKMLFDDVKKLNCETLMQTANQVLNTLTSSWDSIAKSNHQQIASVLSMKSIWMQSLMSCLPLLEMFSSLIENYLLYLLISHQITGKLYDNLLNHFIELATKGFYVLPELSEGAQEGATQFDDKEGGGMGEGEGVKDVSDQIETEDQLEDVSQKDKPKKDQDSNDEADVSPEDNAVEMSEDFDGKTHDPDEEFDENEESEEEDENELDKKMGDIDSKEADKLDDQLWGSDAEEEQDSEEKEETGPGASQEGESQIVAKDENEKSDKPNKEDKPEESETKEENAEDKVNEPEAMDESEYDDKVDPYHGKEQQTQEEKAENLDLPEDLKLDEAEAGNDKDEDVSAESPPNIEEAKTDDLKEPADSKESDDEDKNNSSEKDDSSREDENQTADDGAAPMDVDDVEDGDDEKPDGSDVADDEDDDEYKKNGIEEEQSSAPPQIKDKKIDSEDENMEDDENTESPETQSDKFYGMTEDQKQKAEQSELAQDAGGQNNGQQEKQQQQQAEGASAPSEEIESFPSTSSKDVAKGSSSEGSQKPESLKPSRHENDRSLGSKEKQYQKHMKTLEEVHHSDNEQQREDDEEDDFDKQNEKSDLYQHVADSSSHYNQQMMDVATEKQQSNLPHYEDVEEDDEDDDDDDIESIKDSDDSYIDEDIEEDDDDDDDVEMIESNIVKGGMSANVIEEYVVDDDDDDDEEDEEEDEEDDEDIVEEQDAQIQQSSVELSSDKIMTAGASRPPESTIHTSMKYFDRDDLVDIEELRAEIEEQLSVWSNNQLYGNTVAMERQANDLWQLYEQVTGSLSQELCEQLRLILEPSRATKLKGDYRTGKRINMKKVIPYIASQFRKDKIWLRRTKPSKRDYQVLLAIDDSSSMVDNHSKQLAFESLAVIANALSMLEVGELSICSFGECVQVVHPFNEPFSCQSGARLLQHFTFGQKKTNVAQLLQQSTSMLLETRQHHQSQISNPNLSQLLLIVSDGRGLFAEGVDFVKAAVRQAHSANVFVVFVVLDNPLNKDSILDIRIPVFKASGQLPEIKSYMDHFPFPFYIILRDIDSLPQTLSDALRQWFELVTIEQR